MFDRILTWLGRMMSDAGGPSSTRAVTVYVTCNLMSVWAVTQITVDLMWAWRTRNQVWTTASGKPDLVFITAAIFAVIILGAMGLKAGETIGKLWANPTPPAPETEKKDGET